MSKKTKTPLAILPPPERPPLTVAEALRNIAREALERRRLAAEGEKRPARPERPSINQQDAPST